MPARYDRHVGELEMAEAVITEDGFMLAHAIVARTGVLYYVDGRGSKVAELIPPDELFKKSSLATLGGVPLTDGHPTKDGTDILLTSEDASEHSKGAVGLDIKTDKVNGFVRVDTIWHDGDTINRIRNEGVSQISNGRKVGRIDATPGVWVPSEQKYYTGAEAVGRSGVSFDQIQRDLTYNHAAAVPKGNAGPMVAIRVDSADAVQVEAPQLDRGSTMEKIQIGGVWYDAPKATADAYKIAVAEGSVRTDAMAAEVAEMKAASVRAEAEKEAAKIRTDALQADFDAVDIPAAVKARVALEARVAHLRIDGATGMTDRALKVAAIKVVKADFSDEGKDDVYVEAYFDAFSAVPVKDDGRGSAGSVRHDSAPSTDKMDAKREAWARRGDFRNKKEA